MENSSKLFRALTIVIVSMLVVGCGSPDLASWKPTTSKRATLVFMVNHPSFLTDKALTLPATATTATFSVSDVSSGSLLQTAKTALQNRNISTCMIVGDNLQPAITDLAQLTKGLAQGPLSLDAKKAFFAGLYTGDPAATVVPITPNGQVVSASGNGTSSVGAVVIGSAPSDSDQKSMRALQVPVFSLDTGPLSFQPAIQVGTFETSEIGTFFQQFATGHWPANDEKVFGMPSVTIDTRQMSPIVVHTWSAIEPMVFNQPNLWQSNFQRLPQHTLQMLQSQFGTA